MTVRDTSVISECKATDCTYNDQLRCWAPGIEVGLDHHECDSYTTMGGAKSTRPGFVVDCEANACTHNVAHECSATSVTLGIHEDHADCMTFSVM